MLKLLIQLANGKKKLGLISPYNNSKKLKSKFKNTEICVLDFLKI